MSEVRLAIDVLRKFVRDGAKTEVQITDARLAAAVLLSRVDRIDDDSVMVSQSLLATKVMVDQNH